MRTIDADAHVIETIDTWEFMDEADRKYRPAVLNRTTGKSLTTAGAPQVEHWLIDGRSTPKDIVVDASTPEASREMRDVDGRLKHMDELEIDVQVLYPTMFLRPLTKKGAVQTALARSYNRWLAEIWKKGRGRLRWAAVPPLLNLELARDELARAKDNGACAIFLNGLECDMQLSNAYFFPLYAIAEELDLAVCLHAGINSFMAYDIFLDDNFSKFKLTVLSSFHGMVMEGVPAKFPKARWGFIEVSAQWIPYLFNDLAGRFKRRGRRFPKNLLQENNMYVACQVTDDLPSILPYAGEDNLVIGTDYGHSDSSTEIEALRLLKDSGKVAPQTIDKILGDNPRRLYGL
jgi:predicted TIM-barrel fold metal-dependent hydrolase